MSHTPSSGFHRPWRFSPTTRPKSSMLTPVPLVQRGVGQPTVAVDPSLVRRWLRRASSGRPAWTGTQGPSPGATRWSSAMPGTPHRSERTVPCRHSGTRRARGWPGRGATARTARFPPRRSPVIAVRFPMAGVSSPSRPFRLRSSLATRPRESASTPCHSSSTWVVCQPSERVQPSPPEVSKDQLQRLPVGFVAERPVGPLDLFEPRGELGRARGADAIVSIRN